MISVPTRGGRTHQFKLVIDDPATQNEALEEASKRRKAKRRQRSEARREEAREKVHGASVPRTGHALGTF